MRVTIRGSTGLSVEVDESIAYMVKWLGPCFGEPALPVRLTLLPMRHKGGMYGVAFWPTSSRAKLTRKTHDINTYEAELQISPTLWGIKFPKTYTYKRRAGPATCHSPWDVILHSLAHEFRHVEQYDACRRTWPHGPPVPDGREYNSTATFRMWERNSYAFGSSEVDAEKVAHAMLRAWRDSPEGLRVNGRDPGSLATSIRRAKSLVMSAPPSGM